ncbi:MAG: hypothetical protein ACHP6I_00430 [Rickettsiales bacterium]
MALISQKQFENEQSFLDGKPTSFKNITCRGAKFINIKNTTEARLPSDKELADVPAPTGIISIIKKFLRL